MKVLFLEHVINVWKKWEIKEIKPWYAANFLFPKGLAIELTPSLEKQHKDSLKKQDAHKRGLIENRHKLCETLNWKKLDFSLKVADNWKMYWWIWEKDIIGAVKKNFKIELSKKHIDLPDWHIKKAWETIIYIIFWKDAMAKMFVNVKWN